jgi:hypothetical protein
MNPSAHAYYNPDQQRSLSSTTQHQYHPPAQHPSYPSTHAYYPSQDTQPMAFPTSQAYADMPGHPALISRPPYSGNTGAFGSAKASE